MKYIVILCDGMADWQIPSLNGKTPMQVARKDNMDQMAANGIVGLCKTVPEGLSPGSDVANLSVMGYDPAVYYKGRSSLEAASMGVEFTSDDTTLRCNFVHLSDTQPYEQKTMDDYSAGNVSTKEAEILLQAVKAAFEKDDLSFHLGTTYKHCTVLKNKTISRDFTPPHDISGRQIGSFLPKGEGTELFLDIMRRSHEVLKDHPVNVERKNRGLIPADYLWFWGVGSKPDLPDFYKKTGLKGGVISAVDLVRGIGILAGMKNIEVPGITGGNDTDFLAKADYAVDFLLSGNDYVYIHVDAPDECSHKNDIEGKIKGIELIDSIIISRVRDRLYKANEPYCMLVMPDHYTATEILTHTSQPVPYLIYNSKAKDKVAAIEFSERAAGQGELIENGYTLIDTFIAYGKN